MHQQRTDDRLEASIDAPIDPAAEHLADEAANAMNAVWGAVRLTTKAKVQQGCLLLDSVELDEILVAGNAQGGIDGLVRLTIRGIEGADEAAWLDELADRLETIAEGLRNAARTS